MLKDVMKNKKTLLKEWVAIFPKLACEIVLFFLNIIRYFYLFLHGLRISFDSYSKLLKGVEENEKAIDELFKAKLDEQKTTKSFIYFLNEKGRLLAEQEKLFATLFGIFIAIMALFISTLAILVKK